MTAADSRKVRDYLDALKAIPRPRLQSGEAGEKIEGIRLKALADLNLLATEGEADIAETLTVAQAEARQYISVTTPQPKHSGFILSVAEDMKRGGIPFAFVAENPTAPEFVSIWRRP
jgi:hypothetical protein